MIKVIPTSMGRVKEVRETVALTNAPLWANSRDAMRRHGAQAGLAAHRVSFC